MPEHATVVAVISACILVLTWVLTYVLHSSILLGSAYLLTRRMSTRLSAVRDTIWKTALLGGFVTASLQLALGIEPFGGRVVLPVEGSPSAHPEVPVAPAGVEPAEPEAVWVSLDPTHDAGDAGRGAPSSDPGDRRDLAVAPVAGGGPGSGLVDRLATGVLDACRLAGVGWPVAVVAAWVLLAAGLLARLGLAHWRLSRVLSGRVEEVEGDLTATVDRLSRLAGFDHRVRISLSARTAVPIAFGRREICLPDRVLDELGPDERAGLIAHELAHLVRRDPSWLRLSAILERVFFFQPLNGVARREIQECAEYLCDDHAARLTGSGLALARCLATVAGWMGAPRGSALVAGASGSRSSLVRRVEHLLDDGSLPIPGGRARAAFALTAVIAVAVTVPGVTARQSGDELLAAAPALEAVDATSVPSPVPPPNAPPALSASVDPPSEATPPDDLLAAGVVDRPASGILVHPESSRPNRRTGGVADAEAHAELHARADVGATTIPASATYGGALARPVVDYGSRGGIQVLTPDRSVLEDLEREVRRETRRTARRVARAVERGDDLDTVIREAIRDIDRVEIRDAALEGLRDLDLEAILDEDELEDALEEYADAIGEIAEDLFDEYELGRSFEVHVDPLHDHDHDYDFDFDFDFDFDHDHDHRMGVGYDDRDRRGLDRDEQDLVDAVADGHLDEARELLDTVDADLTFGPRLTLLHLAAAEADVAMARLLLERRVPVDADDRMGRTPLHVAAYEGAPSVAELLLEAGANGDLRDQLDRTPLHVAAGEGDDDLVSMLVAHGVRLDALDARGRTPLLHALAEGHLDIVSALIEAGADADARDDNGVSALHFAVAESDLDAVRLLLRSGARVNARDDHGITPLHRAVIDADFGVIEALLEGGADVNARDDERRTPLDYAHDGDWHDVLELLERHER